MTVPLAPGRTLTHRPQCDQTTPNPCQRRVAGVAFNFSAVKYQDTPLKFPPQSISAAELSQSSATWKA